MPETFDDAVRKVVAGGNCTGCGACALISNRVSMTLSPDGFMRPVIDPSASGDSTSAEGSIFTSMCPGVRLAAPSGKGKRYDAIFGSYVSAWQASAVDPEVRHAGSSGGVLTALSAWMIETGRVSSVVGSGSDALAKSRTIPVRIMSREDALASSGSRYAPVANASLFNLGSQGEAFVGKPCEASAVHQLQDALSVDSAERPIVLSFFCAGTPSQKATDSLLAELGSSPATLSNLRYRGKGWPGRFLATSRDGGEASVSYDVAWSKHLGPTIQWSCKVCPDGTGGHADVAVGDFWATDVRGYPLFEDAAGNSVAIARTERGHRLLIEAAEAGVVTLEPADLKEVAKVQPSQVLRRRTLLGRIVGAALAGKSAPKFSGYHLVYMGVRNPLASIKAGAGTMLRLVRARRLRQ